MNVGVGTKNKQLGTVSWARTDGTISSNSFLVDYNDEDTVKCYLPLRVRFPVFVSFTDTSGNYAGWAILDMEPDARAAHDTVTSLVSGTDYAGAARFAVENKHLLRSESISHNAGDTSTGTMAQDLYTYLGGEGGNLEQNLATVLGSEGYVGNLIVNNDNNVLSWSLVDGDNEPAAMPSPALLVSTSGDWVLVEPVSLSTD
jgi:hypothetical protein